MIQEPFSNEANQLFRYLDLYKLFISKINLKCLLLSYYSKSADTYPKFDEASRKKIMCSFKQSRSDNFIKC